ncbi:putative CRISPR-associated protein [Nodularia sp. NIES-3585]|uniref:putative CRISPR-associated protein n=1 Tax=Nodularia sp. NIES-3585 TaxID=1973477 RepID=UPI000B5C59A2|nr:putative CRISPR-associated protein [Nodularia sp. NIES-3585]GAX37393.1 CRISPR-associated protein, APE2256 family [Nodularia sp. NIES-3585]
MPKLVVSTVGTSLLTNQIDVYTDSEEYFTHIQESANHTEEEISDRAKEIIIELKTRAEEKVYKAKTTKEIRETSAELNGIYGLYEGNLEQAKTDIHWLITTDTYQAQITAQIVQDFLDTKRIKAHIQQPKRLSTINTERFSYGIDELLEWWEGIFLAYQYTHDIYFNLVGGFKALQGYANTIGMLYGAEIIYIFEGNFDFITIPRLPIKIDYSVIKPVQFALMASSVDIWVKLSDLENVPDSLIFKAGDEAKLNNWGRLLWNRCKHSLFTQELLEFPCLMYEKSFLKDYERRTVDNKIKYELHTAISEISATMLKFNGDTSRINQKFKYRRYEGGQKCEGGLKKNQIDHFYLNKDDAWRVSCVVEEIKNVGQKKTKILRMRHFGEHDYVNDNP